MVVSKDSTADDLKPLNGEQDNGEADTPDSRSDDLQADSARSEGPQTASHRRGPGGKEVVPFAWKLVGESFGAILTLFKATERAEVEAQLERARADGYYSNLRILENSEETKQPPSAVRLPQIGKPAIEEAKPKPKRKISRTKRAKSSAAKAASPRKAAAKKPAAKAKAAPKSRTIYNKSE